MDDRSRIEQRIKLCTESDTTKGFLFNGAIAHLNAAMGEQLTQRILANVPGEPDFTAFFNYPVSRFLQLALSAMNLRGALPDTEPFMRWLGRGVVRSALDSPLGKTVGLLSKGDPQSLLSVTPNSVTLVASFGERRYEKTGPRSAAITYRRELFGPDFMIGAGEQTLQSMTKTQITTQVEEINDSASDFRVQYQW